MEWLFNIITYASTYTLEIQQAIDAFKNVNTVLNRNGRSFAYNLIEKRFTGKALRQIPSVLAGAQHSRSQIGN